MQPGNGQKHVLAGEPVTLEQCRRLGAGRELVRVDAAVREPDPALADAHVAEDVRREMTDREGDVGSVEDAVLDGSHGCAQSLSKASSRLEHFYAVCEH